MYGHRPGSSKFLGLVTGVSGLRQGGVHAQRRKNDSIISVSPLASNGMVHVTEDFDTIVGRPIVANHDSAASSPLSVRR